ncbi:MAG: hypothetical protein NTW04_04505 [Elusimicrobia bacterium]|nr:hypothetical protein [Elusimicrobiota bacterium]
MVGAVSIWVTQAFGGENPVVTEENGGYAVRLLSAQMPFGAVQDVLDFYRKIEV